MGNSRRTFPRTAAGLDAAREALQHHLLGDAGRDLRLPLWTIMASVQLLLRSRHLSERDARLADRIDAAAHRLAQLARDILDQALADVGVRMPLTPVETDMQTLAQDALLEARLDNPDRWVIHAGTGDGAAEWDRERIQQLLSNLLSHALEHGSDGAPVSFAWWGDEDEVVVEIEFDPDLSRREPDRTLGLSVAREIARAHGGHLAVRDTPSGRLFRAVLPRQVPAVPDLDALDSPRRAVPADGLA